MCLLWHILYVVSLYIIEIHIVHSHFVALCVYVCMYVRTCVSECVYVCLLDISRQLACMKLGSREKYQPIQGEISAYTVLLGSYKQVARLPNTCHLPIDIQQICYSTQTGQRSHLQRSCCPVLSAHCNYYVRMYMCKCICIM